MTSHPIQKQANELKETLLNPDTIGIFWQTLLILWKLLVQAAKLAVLLVLLLVTQVIVWWSAAFNSGRAARQWILTTQPSEGEVSASLADGIIALLSTIVNWATVVRQDLVGSEGTNLLTGTEKKAIAPASSTPTAINNVAVDTEKLPG
jgi:hypothetical protein